MSHNCRIHCTDHLSCNNASIYCPNDANKPDDPNQQNKSCSIYGGNGFCSLCNIDIYAAHGFDDVEIRCTSSDCLSGSYIHCKYQFETTCAVGTTLNQCNDTTQQCSNLHNYTRLTRTPTMQPTIWLTPFPSPAQRTFIICNATQPCANTTIHCPDTECFVECIASRACLNSTIYCPSQRPCAVHCHDAQSCANATINAIHSTDLEIINDGLHALSSSNIYCPNNGPYSTNPRTSCNFITNGNFTVTNLNIYAVEGFNDISIDCHLRQCHFAQFDGSLYCTITYNTSCSIDNPFAYHCTQPHICDTYQLTAPTKAPSISPSDDYLYVLYIQWQHIVYLLSGVLVCLLLCCCCCVVILVKRNNATDTIDRFPSERAEAGNSVTEPVTTGRSSIPMVLTDIRAKASMASRNLSARQSSRLEPYSPYTIDKRTSGMSNKTRLTHTTMESITEINNSRDSSFNSPQPQSSGLIRDISPAANVAFIEDGTTQDDSSIILTPFPQSLDSPLAIPNDTEADAML